MKKILILFSFLVLSTMAFSQATNSYTAFSADSSVNAETIYLSIDNASAITRNHVITMTLIPVNVTGTATVLCTPQGSLNGTVFFDIQAVADTVNNAGTIAVIKYEYADANWRYYRHKLVSSGTGETDFTGSLGLKKKY